MSERTNALHFKMGDAMAGGSEITLEAHEAVAIVQELEELRHLVTAMSECMSNHHIGVNCHGPVLCETDVKLLRKYVPAETGGEA